MLLSIRHLRSGSARTRSGSAVIGSELANPWRMRAPMLKDQFGPTSPRCCRAACPSLRSNVASGGRPSFGGKRFRSRDKETIQAQQARDFHGLAEFRRGFAAFQFRQEPHTEPTQARELFQCQALRLALGSQDSAQLGGRAQGVSGLAWSAMILPIGIILRVPTDHIVIFPVR